MKLAYLLASYPMTSTTFIKNEIEAIEAATGAAIKRYACRQWDVPLVDPKDQAEQARTEYLLTGNLPRLLVNALIEIVAHLPRFVATLPLWWRVYRAAGGGLGRHLGYLVQALHFRRRTAALGIEHVHTHFSTNAACVAMLARKLGGASYSFTVHGPDELVDPAALSLSEKVRHAAFVVAITDYCRGRIAAEAPDCLDKIVIVRCGIDIPDFVVTDPDPAAAHRLVCVGRLCANKAQVLIPPAVALVRDEFPDLVIDLIGDGDQRSLIEAEAKRLEVERHVRILGWAANELVRAEIARSAALLLPTLAEGLPIVIMESFALGRPVLTTRIAGIPELVDAECGWVIEPGSVDALAEALRALLRSSREQRIAMGREGRRRVQRSHDLHRSAAQLVDLFRTRGGIA